MTGRCSAHRGPTSLDPDWFLDPVTGRRAPDAALAFGIDHRDETVTGNVKSVWELSRHHHLTVLAAAWWLTSDARYADVVAAQLRSWWARNPFLSGIHWTSGIELGVRLTSWVWIRRLLDDWPGVSRPLRGQPAGPRPAALAPGAPRGVPQPRVVGEQPRHRRGRGPARGGVRLPVVRRERGLAPRRRPRAGARAGRQHLPERRQPRARHRLPPVRHRARARGPRGGGGRGAPAGRRDPVPARAIPRRRRRPARRGGPPAAAGRRRRGPRARPRRPRRRPLGGPAGLRCEHSRRLRLVAAGLAGCDEHAPRVRSPRRPGGRRPARGSARGRSPMPGSTCCARPRATGPRSGAAATAAPTGSSPSPRTATPTRCRSRSVTTASSCSSTRARTATTASPSGGATSARPVPTTPSRSTARTRCTRPAPSCGPDTRTPSSTAATSGPAGRQMWTAHHTAYSRLDAALCHDREVVLDGTGTAAHRHRHAHRQPGRTGCGCPGTSVPRSRPSSSTASPT